MMYSVLPELYDQVAARLLDAIDGTNYYSGSLLFAFEGLQCRFTASVIVYREHLVQPEGHSEPVCDLVPVWWEFHTIGDEGELVNDFDFSELKSRL